MSSNEGHQEEDYFFIDGNTDLDFSQLANKKKLYLFLLQQPDAMFQFIATNTTSLKCLKVALHRSRPNDWRLLGQALARNTSVQTMEIVVHGYLHAQPLGHEAAVELFPFLAQNYSLQELTLRGEFSNSELEAFTDGLKHNRAVTQLYIACTSVSLVGESLKCHPTVKQLSLMSAEVSAEQLQRFAEGLNTNQALTTLMWTLSLNSPFEPFCHYLRSTKTLSRLSIELLPSASLDQVCNELCRALVRNTSLTTVHVSGLQSSCDCMDLLRYNKTITTLSLSGNFSTSSFLAINTALGQNKTITKLKLAGIKTKEGLQAIKEAWIMNDTLIDVEICAHYAIRNMTMPPTFYSDIMKRNKTISTIKIPHIGVSDLIALINATTSLTDVTVMDRYTFHDPSDETLAALREALERNYSLTRVKLRQTVNKTVGYLPTANEFCERNILLKKQFYQDTALTMHIMARSELFAVLPIELWHAIFSHIRYPGLSSFEALAKVVFKRYVHK